MKIRFAFSLAVVVMVAGCATARVVSMRPGKGGVIAISSMDDKDQRAKAEELMKDNCKGKYTILTENEAVIAKHKSSRSHTDRTPTNSKPILGGLGSINTGGESTRKETAITKDKEWRITYSCDP